jgi:hypothetical protein
MADIRTSSLGGVPKGETADRPSSPSIGDVFYNGTLGCLEIYTSQGWVANSAPPGIPTIGTATYSATNKAYNNASASIAFTPGEGGGLPNSYRATSTPGGFTGTGSSSPITVSGLQSATAYTFSVTGTNNFGTSAGSINSNSITANTVPEQPGTPVATYVSNTSVTLAFTAGASGGASITNYKYSTDGTNYTAFSPTQTSSPLTITGLTAFSSYTFYIKAVNTNGDSTASLASNSIFTGSIVSGGTLTSDSTYHYRTFTGTGNFTVSNGALAADILVVAGGGSGSSGSYAGGGGGAGGYLEFASQSLPASTYNVTVGGGGPSPSNTAAGNDGTASRFGALTNVIGGGGAGGGAGGNANNGRPGGSGGGGATNDTSGGGVTYGGANTSGQGFAGGGNGNFTSPPYPSGGGGGAGAAGQTGPNSTTAGSGGVGKFTTLSNTIGAATSSGQLSGGNYYYAGGGAGGTHMSSGTNGSPGLGGGGASGTQNGAAGSPGTSNTGGGGGSGTQNTLAGAGGSGIVVVRYTKSQVAP